MTDTSNASAPKKARGPRIEVKPPTDTDMPRNLAARSARWFSLMVTVGIIIIFPFIFASIWKGLLPSGMSPILTIATIAFIAWALSHVKNRVLIQNDEWTAYVTQDPFSGENIAYGPGLHPSHIWESRNEDGNISLKVVTINSKLSVPTQTAQVTVDLTMQWTPSSAGILNHIGIGASTIENGLTAILKTYVTETIADKTAEEARKGVTVLNDAIDAEFMGTASSPITNFERNFGISVVSIVIQDIALPPDVQRTRDAADEAIVLRRVMAELKGMSVEDFNAATKSGAISSKEETELRNHAMAASGNAKMDLIVIQGGDSTQAVIAEILKNQGKK